MNDRSFAKRCVVAIALLFLPSACAEPQVIRVFDGMPVAGRFIEYEAYAAYGRGLEAEQDGNTRDAARWFHEAARYDPKSVEIWTRIGATTCSLGARDKALEAFAKAELLDPTYEPLFRARALCEFHNRRYGPATTYAAHAVELAPDQDEAIVLYARCLEIQQKLDEAVRLVDGHLLRHPNSISVLRMRFDLARRQQDALTMKRSAEVLLRLAPTMANELTTSVPELAPLGRVDDAIRQGNIDDARQAARRAHLPPAELAVRAAAMGAAKLAREQAEHVLGADPSSGSARVALASASDALADDRSVGVALELPVGERITPLSPLARLVFTELLVRHTSRDAAWAFVGSLESDKTNDPVYESLRVHLVQRLGETNRVKTGGI